MHTPMVPMSSQALRGHRQRGFTLLELMIAVAVIAVVVAIAAPSFKQFIVMQRLKGINAQLVTDMQYARSEAVSRGVPVHVKVQPANPSIGCYVIFTTTTAINSTSPTVVSQCNCSAAEGARCTAPAVELRTVQVPTDLSVYLNIIPFQAANFAFDPRTGGIQTVSFDFASTAPDQFAIDAYLNNQNKFRNVIGLTGRVKVCIPTGSTLQGTAC